MTQQKDLKPVLLPLHDWAAGAVFAFYSLAVPTMMRWWDQSSFSVILSEHRALSRAHHACATARPGDLLTRARVHKTYARLDSGSELFRRVNLIAEIGSGTIDTAELKELNISNARQAITMIYRCPNLFNMFRKTSSIEHR
jgi:hypothetical protein